MDDLKKGVQELYHFVLNYNYYVKAHEIKSKLYNEAIKYMKRDLKNDEEKEEELQEEKENEEREDNVQSD